MKIISEMNTRNCVNEAFADKTWEELVDVPISALKGISEAEAETLKKVFNVETISDLANLKYVELAKDICVIAKSKKA